MKLKYNRKAQMKAHGISTSLLKYLKLYKKVEMLGL